MREVKQSTWLCRTDTTPHNMKILTLGLCLLIPVMAQAGKALPIALQAPTQQVLMTGDCSGLSTRETFILIRVSQTLCGKMH